MSTYTNLDTNTSPWAEKPRSNRRKKLTVVGSLIAVVAIIIAGVVAGVVLAKRHKSSTSAIANGNGNSPVVSNPNDPSDFQKDPRLLQSFFGLAYTPAGAQLPNCGATLGPRLSLSSLSLSLTPKLDAVIEDIQLMSQLTKNIRMYGPDCNQTALVLDAIQRTKVDMQVYVGLYPVINNSTVLQIQLDELEVAFKTFGVDHVAPFLTVGNEIELDYLTANGGAQQDINDSVGDQAAQQLIGMLNMTKTWWNGLGIDKPMSFCNADAGSYFNQMVVETFDCLFLNEHPFFADVTADQAAGWVDVFNNSTLTQYFQSLTKPAPQAFIAETGWPSSANDTAHASDGVAVASIQGLQTFLDTFVCQANENNTKAFFFEAFDEPYKQIQFGGVEAHWGLFYANKTLKEITIPKCSTVPS